MTLLFFVAISASPASAHGAERGLIMLLPTGFYIFGGACAVFLSFLILALVPQGYFKRVSDGYLPLLPAFSLPKVAVSFCAFLLLAICIVAGFVSAHDPLSNPLPLIIWTAWWVGLTLFQAIVGNLWPWFNPWTGLFAVIRKATFSRFGLRPFFTLPASVGYLPAIAQFALFAWFELISIAPEDPPRLAYAAGFYWIVNFIAIAAFGEGEWLKRGEPFSVFFRMVGMFSPFAVIDTGNGKKVCLTWPGRKCLGEPPLPFTGTMFVLLTLGTASFDGFAETFTWLGFISVNPLEFPGRSGVMVQNSLGLAITPIILALIFYGSVGIGAQLAGRTGKGELQTLAGRLVYSIIPISIAFHSAHYLTQLLINGQYLIVAISDPFALDWNVFGTVDMHVTASFLQNLHDVRIIWTTQTLMIVVGHVAGIVVAHIIAENAFASSKRASISQIPLAIVMIFYTIFGLWLLSTPTVG